MELDLWRVFASLGVPGVALGVLYMLFRQFKWQFPSVPKAWVGPIVVLFICVTGALVYSALYFWAPGRAPAKPPPATTASPAPSVIEDVDISGRWVADVVIGGEKRRWWFSFESFGQKLYGTAHTWHPYSPGIQDGRIEGNKFVFRTVWKNRWSSDPAQRRDVWMMYAGKVTGSRIDFITQDDDGHAPFKFSAFRAAK